MLIRNTSSLLVRNFSTTIRCLEKEELSKKVLRVAIIGAPNAGKSTLLNRLVQSDISCVSKLVHTTRRNVLGVYTEGDTQIEFYDSPGVVTRKHVRKYQLDHAMLVDPMEAAMKCDLIAAIIDASNIREQKRLNPGVLEILNDHRDKKSILIMNKIDLVKEKRLLLDISTRLRQGHLNGKLTMSKRELYNMTDKDLRNLNLISHLPDHRLRFGNRDGQNRRSKFVIDLEKKDKVGETQGEESFREPIEFNPDAISFKYFDDVFSISALTDDGVIELRDYMKKQALPIDRFPRTPDYLTDQSTKDIVLSIIRGNIMNVLPGGAAYGLHYKNEQFTFDDSGALHLSTLITCPNKYALMQVIGEKGCIISRVTGESREKIANSLGCEVKISLNVEVKKQAKG